MISVDHGRAWFLLSKREGGEEECWGRGGVMREGGRNSLKGQGEVRVATDRQIATERDRQCESD